jgi:hypothetical protein
MTTGYIYDSERQFAWIVNDHAVFSVATRQQFAKVRDRQLFSMRDEPLGLYLRGLGVPSSDGEPAALARFKKLAS